MRSSVFTIPAGTTANTYTVNSPDTVLPTLTGAFQNGSQAGGFIDVNNITGGTLTSSYIGRAISYLEIGSVTYNGTITNITNLGTSQPRVFVNPAPVAPLAQGTAVTITGGTVANPIPIGSTVIPLTSTVGLIVGDSITGTGIATGTTVAAVTSTTVTLSLPTIAVLNNGATITEPAQAGIIIYPVDQYVAPVEISIQAIDGASQVTVQASVLPLDQIESGPWFNYVSDGGQSIVGSAGTINTYSNKVITAVRLSNAGISPVRVALAEGGIIS